MLPKLVSVTLFGALAVSRSYGPEPEDVVGGRASVPVPVRLTACGLLGSLSAMTRVADRMPAAVGLKSTLIVQLPRPATLPPATHVELDRIAKSPGFVRVGVRGAKLTTLRLEMLSGVLPRFASVTVFRELLPTSCAPKLSEVGESRTVVPVPLRLTVCVLPATPLLLSVMVNVPVSGPVAMGEKVTLIVQEPPAATLLPQLLVSPKSALAAMLVIMSAALPVLLRVAGFDPLVVPRFWLPNVKFVGERPTIGSAGLVTVTEVDPEALL